MTVFPTIVVDQVPGATTVATGYSDPSASNYRIYRPSAKITKRTQCPTEVVHGHDDNQDDIEDTHDESMINSEFVHGDDDNQDNKEIVSDESMTNIEVVHGHDDIQDDKEGSRSKSCSTSHDASSHQSHTTDGSENTETPFFPPRDLRHPGAFRYAFSKTNNTTPSASAPSSVSSGLSISVGPSQVTPQENWALKRFLSTPLLNDDTTAQGSSEAGGTTKGCHNSNDEDDSMSYSYDDRSKLLGAFSTGCWKSL
jgi:hypothetical protein